jgi:uncharacterized protein (TIGR02145 family)
MAGCEKSDNNSGGDNNGNGNGNNGNGADSVLAIDKTTISAVAAGGTYQLQVTATQSWSAEVSAGATWCTVSPATGNGNGTTVVNIAENSTEESRSATITFTSGSLTQTVSLLQDESTGNDDNPNSQLLTITPVSIHAIYIAYNYSLDVEAAPLQAWSAKVDAAAAAWCVLYSASATDNGTVWVNVAENHTIDIRMATITFTSGSLTQTVSLLQDAAPAALSLDKYLITAAGTAGSYTVGVTSTMAWTASVNNEAATWCTFDATSGTGNGTVTVNVIANQTGVQRAATVTFTAGILTRAVYVTQAASLVPPYAASAQTWTFGSQTWSDAIHIPACNKSSFTNDYNYPQCRSYTENGTTWYYYNWPYINANAAMLCPSPWRVPTQSDISTLISALGGNYTYQSSNVWGYGGGANGNSMDNVGSMDIYWSATEDPSNTNFAYILYFSTDNYVYPQYGTYKYFGLQVRCVK